MIYVTSDTHIPTDIRKINARSFDARVNAGAGDFLLICGDFGGVWDGSREERYWLKWLDRKPYTTLFIDGNHENHRRLADAYPEEDYCGGRVHRISDKIYHLMRGYVFDLDGRRVFAMGGAASHDREQRTEGVDWWPEEMPSAEEYERARRSLGKCGWKVDVVATHCAPDRIQRACFPDYTSDELTYFLDEVDQRLAYRQWYFGHYHVDRRIDEQHICLYDAVIRSM